MMKMKQATLAILALAASAAAFADSPVVATLFEDGTTNTWTQAELVAALELQNQRYHRDIKTLAGRKAWWGEPEYRYETNTVDGTLAQIEVYHSGAFCHTNKAVRLAPPGSAVVGSLLGNPTGIAEKEATLRSMEAELAAMPDPPPDDKTALARARLSVKIIKFRRALAREKASAATNTVDVVVTPEKMQQ